MALYQKRYTGQSDEFDVSATMFPMLFLRTTFVASMQIYVWSPITCFPTSTIILLHFSEKEEELKTDKQHSKKYVLMFE